MSLSTAAIMKRLRELGAPPEAIEYAIEQIESIVAKDLERKANQAARKRRSRDSHGTVTGHDCDSHGHIPQTKVSPTPPSKTHPLKGENTTTRARAFPSDFEPNETDFRVGRELGMADNEIRSEVPRCHDHHAAKGNVFKDVHAAFRTWLRSPYRSRPPPPLRVVNGNHFGGNREADRDRYSAHAAAKRIRERLESGGDIETGGTDAWLLPQDRGG